MFSFCHFISLLYAFVVLGLVSSVLSLEIGWEERLQNELFCVIWDVKPYLKVKHSTQIDLTITSQLMINFYQRVHSCSLGAMRQPGQYHITF